MSVIYCDTSQLPARRRHDFYPTAPATAQAALQAFQTYLEHAGPRALGPGYALDPGAGTGVWGEALRRCWPLARVWGVELRLEALRHPCYEGWITDDYLSPGMDPLVHGPCYDLVLGNPPYRDAEAFVERSLGWVHEGGHVLFLLRLAFLEGQKRRDGLFARHPLRQVWVCSRRPSFQPDGKTQPTAYAVYLWRKGYQGPTALDYLREGAH